MGNMKKYKMRNLDYRKASQEKGIIKINGRIFNLVSKHPLKSVAEKIANDTREKQPGESVRIFSKKNKQGRNEYQVFSTGAPKSLGAKLLSFVHR